jgi:hypothetical protein
MKHLQLQSISNSEIDQHHRQTMPIAKCHFVFALCGYGIQMLCTRIDSDAIVCMRLLCMYHNTCCSTSKTLVRFTFVGYIEIFADFFFNICDDNVDRVANDYLNVCINILGIRKDCRCHHVFIFS